VKKINQKKKTQNGLLKKHKTLFKECEKDWNFFASRILGVSLDNKQREILRAIQNNKRVSVRSCHARGKDFVSAVASICFLSLNKPSKVINTAPTFRQVKDIMMTEISRIYNNAKFPLGGTLLVDRIKFDNPDWFFEGFKTSDRDTESWGGYHSPNLMVVVTEASGIEKESYESIEGILTGGNSKLVLVFNPHRTSGEAYQSTCDPQFVSFKLSAFDAPNVRAKRILYPGQVDWDWVNDHVHKRGWTTEINESEANKALLDFKWEGKWYRPSDKFLVRVMGEFPRASEDKLIPLFWIEKANERWENRRRANGGFLILGVDVAGMGRDKTVFTYRYGNVIEKFDIYPKMSLMEVAGKIKNILDTEGGIAYIDGIGEGAGVFSRLDEQGVNCVCAKASYVNKDLTDLTEERTFMNMRAYCFWALRDALNPEFDDLREPMALPPGDELTQELTEVRWGTKSNGDIFIEPKDRLKARLGRSPDMSDSLAFCFWPSDDWDEGWAYVGD